jgi:hypothetical protein
MNLFGVTLRAEIQIIADELLALEVIDQTIVERLESFDLEKSKSKSESEKGSNPENFDSELNLNRVCKPGV